MLEKAKARILYVGWIDRMEKLGIEQAETSKSLSPSNLFSYFLHQDNLMWNRLQTIGVIQIGALGSAYGLASTQWLSLSILVLATILTLVIFFLLKRDELIRIKIEIHLGQFGDSVSRVWYAPLKGREAIWIITICLLAADIILGLAVILNLIPVGE